jgi:hypothetical protein
MPDRRPIPHIPSRKLSAGLLQLRSCPFPLLLIFLDRSQYEKPYWHLHERCGLACQEGFGAMLLEQPLTALLKQCGRQSNHGAMRVGENFVDDALAGESCKA